MNGAVEARDPCQGRGFLVLAVLAVLYVLAPAFSATKTSGITRALVRSDLWNPALHVRRADLPSIGTILAAHTGGKADAAAYDEEAEIRMPATLY